VLRQKIDALVLSKNELVKVIITVIVLLLAALIKLGDGPFLHQLWQNLAEESFHLVLLHIALLFGPFVRITIIFLFRIDAYIYNYASTKEKLGYSFKEIGVSRSVYFSFLMN
jgi:hypothetical protein